MSLDWDVTRLVDKEVHFPPDENGKMNDALHVLIWMTISVGIGEITESNRDTFWVRTNLWQTAIGSGFNRAVPEPYTLVINSDGSASTEVNDEGHARWEPFLLTKDDVYNAVGLKTNASRDPKTTFLNRLWDAANRTML